MRRGFDSRHLHMSVFKLRDWREQPCLCLVVIEAGVEVCIRCGYTPEQRAGGRVWADDALISWY